MALNTGTYPIRDLTDEQVRNLIGQVATVKVYTDAESVEPLAKLTGVVLLIAIGVSGEVNIVFEGVEPEPYGADIPLTVELDSPLAG
jgi:hypothetical protein